MSFAGETSTIKKRCKYRSEIKNIQFFLANNVYFLFQKMGNILKKINFNIQAIKARIALQFFNK